MFIIRNVSKFAEEDNWKEGCLPGTGQLFDLDVSFEGNAPADVIAKFADFLGQNPKDAEKNVCDEPGRVEFGVTENAEGSQLSKAETKDWKRGAVKAWYAVYTGYVEEVTPTQL